MRLVMEIQIKNLDNANKKIQKYFDEIYKNKSISMQEDMVSIRKQINGKDEKYAISYYNGTLRIETWFGNLGGKEYATDTFLDLSLNNLYNEILSDVNNPKDYVKIYSVDNPDEIEKENFIYQKYTFKEFDSSINNKYSIIASILPIIGIVLSFIFAFEAFVYIWLVILISSLICSILGMESKLKFLSIIGIVLNIILFLLPFILMFI